MVGPPLEPLRSERAALWSLGQRIWGCDLGLRGDLTSSWRATIREAASREHMFPIALPLSPSQGSVTLSVLLVGDRLGLRVHLKSWGGEVEELD